MSKGQRRKGLAVLILSAWALALAWHAKREYLRPASVRLAEASANIVPAASFYTIKLGDAPIGYASARIDTLPDGFILEDDMRLRISALGRDVPASARTWAKLGPRLDLEEFEFSLRSDFGDYQVRATMQGDSVLDVTIEAGGDEQRFTIETEGPVLLPQVMPLHFALGENPEPGKTYAFEVFDPSIMERQRVDVEVVGRETLIYPDSVELDDESGWVTVTYDTVETWHVKQRFGGVEIESWLDPDGRSVRSTSPLGYTIERTAFEIAWDDYRNIAAAAPGAGPDIIELTAISVGVDLPRGEQLGGLAVRLLNVDLKGFDLDGERQALRGDTLFIGVGVWDGMGAKSGLASPKYNLPAIGAEWEETLASTPFIQADDPEVRRVAEQAVGGSRDPLVAARCLNDWVYENLEKEITLSLPNARQVLGARRGDCNEHTVLYVALARAAGLPARTAAGLVYVRGRFYYHAWPEVWLDRWVPVDPTLGQFPADASHLRFVIGGLARQVELVRLIGSLELDVVGVVEK